MFHYSSSAKPYEVLIVLFTEYKVYLCNEF